MNVRIAHVLRLFGGMLILALAILTGVSLVSLNHVRIGGQTFEKIAANDDLTADILPPPLYLVEAHLWVMELEADPSHPGEATQRLDLLHRQYLDRIAHWRAHAPSGEVADLLFQKLDPAARAFWDVVYGEVLPAVRRGDRAALAVAGEHIDLAYARQRQAVDQLIPMLEAHDKALQSTADSVVRGGWIGVIVTAILTAAGTIVALALVRRRVLTPIEGMSRFMTRLAEGDYGAPPPYLDRRDEVGEMAASVEVFRQAALERQSARLQQEEGRRANEAERAARDLERKTAEDQRADVVQRLANGLAKMAAGNLATRLPIPFPDEYERLRTDFNAAVEALDELIGTIGTSVGGVDSGSREIAQAADDLSRRTEQQAASLEQTAAALDQLTATVKQTAEAARDAHSQVAGARGQAQQSGDVVRSAVTAMARIEESSRQIGQIIGVIDEIAFQTNLLALNAGVEAARAGEAGRGFAVVASEVRALAQRSAEAAKEIKALILASNDQVTAGVDLVGRTGEALAGIMDQVSNIDVLVTSIAASAGEQSSGLGEVNVAINQMDQMTQQNAAMVEQTTAAAHAMRASSGDLATRVQAFVTTAEVDCAPPPVALRRPQPALVARNGLAVARAPRADSEGWEEF